MKRFILVVMVLIRRYYNLIFKSQVFSVIKRLGLGYVNGNGAFHVSHDVADANVSIYLLVVYLLLMLTITIHILIPKAFKREHQKIFKYIRWCNVGIVIVFAITDCLKQGKLVEAPIIGAIIEVAIELAHPAILGH